MPKAIKDILVRKLKKGYLFKHDTLFDIMHTNSIELLDRDIKGLGKKGDILLSIREIDLVAVLDAQKEQIIWQWGPGIISRQHHPTLLDNGNILIYDNGHKTQHTQIIELDPAAKKIVWTYEGSPEEPFWSFWGGSSQRLPNGNTLIAESISGRAFEVTRDGKIVWEFYNPDISTKRKARATIYRLMRITNPEDYPVLKTIQPGNR